MNNYPDIEYCRKVEKLFKNSVWHYHSIEIKNNSGQKMTRYTPKPSIDILMNRIPEEIKFNNKFGNLLIFRMNDAFNICYANLDFKPITDWFINTELANALCDCLAWLSQEGIIK